MDESTHPLVAVDVGEAVTVACCWDGRAVRIARASSTPDDPVRGVAAAIGHLDLQSLARPAADGCRFDLVHGPTVATDALLQQNHIRRHYLMQASGGRIATQVAGRDTVESVGCGAAAGIMAALGAGRALGVDRLIVCEMDGAGARVSLGLGGPAWRCGTSAGGRSAGFPMLDVMHGSGADIEQAVRSLSARHGQDPRSCALVVYGPMGGKLACLLAAELGIRRVIVPACAAALNAVGMLHADIVHDYVRFLTPGAEIDLVRLRAGFADMMEEAANDVQSEGCEQDDSLLERYADMRYQGCSETLTVPIESLTDPVRLLAPFHAAYVRSFGDAHQNPSSHQSSSPNPCGTGLSPVCGEGSGMGSKQRPVEIIALRTRCIITTPKPAELRLTDGGGDPVHARLPEPPIDVSAGTNWPRAVCYDRTRLLVGDRGDGPAIIVEPGDATLIAPGWHWEIHQHGHLHASASSLS